MTRLCLYAKLVPTTALTIIILLMMTTGQAFATSENDGDDNDNDNNDRIDGDSSGDGGGNLFSDGFSDVKDPSTYDPSGIITKVNETLSNYTNKEHGITFLFPANWNQTDPGFVMEGLHTVSVQGPDLDPNVLAAGPGFTVKVFTTESYLDPTAMQIKNNTVEEFAASDLQKLENIQYSLDNSIGLNADIIKNQPQGDAWRVEYITSAMDRQLSYNILVFVKNEQTGMLYKLHFTSAPLDAPKQLPVANNIIESFRFI